MKKWLAIALLAGGLFYSLKKSSPSRAGEASFQGVYRLARESGVSIASPDVEEVDLTVDKDRFALHSRAAGDTGGAMESWKVYDGEFLHSKSVYHPSPTEVSQGYAAEEPSVFSSKATPQELHLTRFWSRSFPGEAGAGGKIAGRDTVLYQARSQMPDSTSTTQAWVDAETGIVLKSVESIYAKQIEEVLHKNTVECRSVRFGPVDEAAFRKPQ